MQESGDKRDLGVKQEDFIGCTQTHWIKILRLSPEKRQLLTFIHTSKREWASLKQDCSDVKARIQRQNEAS